MVLCRIIPLLLIIFMLQVGALTPERDVQKQHNFAIAEIFKSFTMLKDLYTEAKSTVDGFQSCGTGTYLEIFRVANEKLTDFQGCVNATREIANYEEFLSHLYYFGKFVGHTVVDIVKAVVDCRHQPGFFAILNCTVSELQSSGPEFDEILTRAKSLVAEVADDTNQLVYYLKVCFGHSSSQFLSETHSLVKRC